MGHLQDESDSFAGEEDSPLLGGNLARRYGEQESNGSVSQLVDIERFDKSRWRSIRVMYLTVFLGAITFTITMSSLWPFLQVLDPSSKSSFLGWVVASYSLGQLIASPLFGAWANYRQSSKEPLTVSLIMMVLSNLFYTYLQSMPNHKDVYMILARGLIGFSAGNIAVVRSYVSGATTVQERTSTMANLSMCQAMGFILGPVFQSILVLVKYPGPVESAGFHFNMYTAPAFFAASVALFNFILFLIIFKEYRLSNDGDDINANVQAPSDDAMEKSMDDVCKSNSYEQKEYKLDTVAVYSSIFLFFVVLFMFTVFETIGTPLTMHMYAWSKSKATFYQGIILGAGGFLSIFVFAGTKYLAKKYSERNLLLIGFLFCFAGFFILIPWGHIYPPRSMAPVKNSSRPTGSEAILYTITDLLYEHKHAFGGDDSQDINENKSIAFHLPEEYLQNKGMIRQDISPNGHIIAPLQPTSLPSNFTSLYNFSVHSTIRFYSIDKNEISTTKHTTRSTTTPSTTTPTSKHTTRSITTTTTPTTKHTTRSTTTTTTPTTTKHTTRSTTTTTPTTTKHTTRSITTTTAPTTTKHTTRSTTTTTAPTTTKHTTRSTTTTAPTTTKHTTRSTTTPSTTSPTTSKHTTRSTTTTTITTTPTTTKPTTTTTPTTTKHTTRSTTTPSTTSPTTSKHTTRSTTTPSPSTSKHTTNSTHIPSTTGLTPSNHTYAPEGCPWQYDWCAHVPVIQLAQYLFASFVITIGYPMCNMLTYTIYSKVLGPKPQGLWMGWLTAAGSLARTVGPIYVSQIYDEFGPQITYGSITCFVASTIFFYLFVYRRLVPFSYTTNPRAPLLFWRKRNRQL